MPNSIKAQWIVFGAIALLGAFVAPFALADDTDDACHQCYAVCNQMPLNAQGQASDAYHVCTDKCTANMDRCEGRTKSTAKVTKVPHDHTLTGYDKSNADKNSERAICSGGVPRGHSLNCTLANDIEGQGQVFTLSPGPNVPVSRAHRGSQLVKCAGGTQASFFANGRIKSCTLDNNGAGPLPLMDNQGELETCSKGQTAVFDPEGRMISCN